MDKTDNSKICPSCGKELPSDCVFCVYCGTDINKEESPIEELVAPHVVQKQISGKEKGKKASKAAMILSTACVFFCGIAVAEFFILNQNHVKDLTALNSRISELNTENDRLQDQLSESKNKIKQLNDTLLLLRGRGIEPTDENGSEVETIEKAEENTPVEEIHKRPTSVIASTDGKSYDSSIKFLDDGSYVIKVTDNQYDYLIYFFSNGVIHKIETYEFSAESPDGELTQISYYVFGIPTRSQAYLRHFATIKDLGHLIPEYDSEGNIINENYIAYANNDNMKNRNEDSEAYIVKKDSKGRICRISENYLRDGYDMWGAYTCWDVSYAPNEVLIMGYEFNPEKYDIETRTKGVSIFNDGARIIYNDRGQPIELQHFENLDRDKNPILDKVTYFEYDKYGYLIHIDYGSGGDYFEYSY